MLKLTTLQEWEWTFFRRWSISMLLRRKQGWLTNKREKKTHVWRTLFGRSSGKSNWYPGKWERPENNTFKKTSFIKIEKCSQSVLCTELCPPKPLWGSPESQWGGIRRWGHWEALGHKGGTSMMGSVTLGCFHSLHLWKLQWDGGHPKAGRELSPEPTSAGTFILYFQPAGRRWMSAVQPLPPQPVVFCFGHAHWDNLSR